VLRSGGAAPGGAERGGKVTVGNVPPGIGGEAPGAGGAAGWGAAPAWSGAPHWSHACESRGFFAPHRLQKIDAGLVMNGRLQNRRENGRHMPPAVRGRRAA
jgi:hypothetical protein